MTLIFSLSLERDKRRCKYIIWDSIITNKLLKYFIYYGFGYRNKIDVKQFEIYKENLLKNIYAYKFFPKHIPFLEKELKIKTNIPPDWDDTCLLIALKILIDKINVNTLISTLKLLIEHRHISGFFYTWFAEEIVLNKYGISLGKPLKKNTIDLGTNLNIAFCLKIINQKIPFLYKLYPNIFTFFDKFFNNFLDFIKNGVIENHYYNLEFLKWLYKKIYLKILYNRNVLYKNIDINYSYAFYLRNLDCDNFENIIKYFIFKHRTKYIYYLNFFP